MEFNELKKLGDRVFEYCQKVKNDLKDDDLNKLLNKAFQMSVLQNVVLIELKERLEERGIL